MKTILRIVIITLLGLQTNAQCLQSSSGDIVSGINASSWGQSVQAEFSGELQFFSFNAATNIPTTATLTISDGIDCSANTIHSQAISSIVDGNNTITLSNTIAIIAGNYYYFRVSTDDESTWTIRFDTKSEVIGNLSTYEKDASSSSCARNFSKYDWSFSIGLTPPKVHCIIASEGDSISGLNRSSWGQSFEASCNGELQSITFNSATQISSSATMVIRDGTTCNANVLYSQSISSIIDGVNTIELKTLIAVSTANTYYFSINTDDESVWKIRFNTKDQVAGNLHTYQKASSPFTSCERSLLNYDWNFSVNITSNECVTSSTENILDNLTRSSWGQNFQAEYNGLLQSISFESATNLSSSATIAIKNGNNCNSTTLYSQNMSSIIEGVNTVDLNSPMNLSSGDYYYFSITTNDGAEWKINYNDTSLVLGNLQTYTDDDTANSCAWDFIDYDWNYSLEITPSPCAITSSGIRISLNKSSWGQSFQSECDGQLQSISFNSASDISTTATITIKNGLDCNAAVLYSQSIPLISNGTNAVILDNPITVSNGADYYFSVQTDDDSNWNIRFNSKNQVNGNLHTYEKGEAPSTCARSFVNFDWDFSIEIGDPAIMGENIDLFILAGQSNAQGWQGNAAYYPEDPQQLDSLIRLDYTYIENTSSDGWIAMEPQEGRFEDGHFGLEVSFSRKLIEAGYNPAIFKFSKGASGLNGSWKIPGDDGYYDDMIIKLNTRITQLESLGHTVTIRGFIWIQGESDSGSVTSSNAYFDNLTKLLSDLRNNVAKNDALPIILGIDEQHEHVVANPTVLEAQQTIANNDAHIKFTSMYGLEKKDTTHLTPAGLVAHGEVVYNAMICLLSNNTSSECEPELNPITNTVTRSASELKNTVIAYPNPTESIITIKDAKSSLEHIKIYNAAGIEVTKQVSFLYGDKTELTFDLSKLKTGIYYIKTNATTKAVYKK